MISEALPQIRDRPETVNDHRNQFPMAPAEDFRLPENPAVAVSRIVSDAPRMTAAAI